MAREGQAVKALMWISNSLDLFHGLFLKSWFIIFEKLIIFYVLAH